MRLPFSLIQERVTQLLNRHVYLHVSNKKTPQALVLILRIHPSMPQIPETHLTSPISGTTLSVYPCRPPFI